MTILSLPSLAQESESRARVAVAPRSGQGSAFAEPWQAQAFALAIKLAALGHFTWNEWAAALGEALRAARDGGEPDDGSRYYHLWLTTLERLVVEKGLADPKELCARKAAWVTAYRLTPHGCAVQLNAACGADS